MSYQSLYLDQIADTLARDIAILLAEAKSPVYQKYVGDVAVYFGFEEWECFDTCPECFGQWVQKLWKKGYRPHIAAGILSRAARRFIGPML